jgi:hypothetical protein
MTDLLEQHFSQLRNPVDDSDWRVVRRRATRSGRRVALAAAAVLAVGLLVAPGVGVGGRMLDLIQGEPAPPAVQESFARSNEAREQFLEDQPKAREELARRFPRVIPGEARGVVALETADGPLYLWVAPTEDGRQCWLIQTGEESATGRVGGFGTCESADDHTGPIVPEGPAWTDVLPNIKFFHVRVYDEEITRVDVELDGAAPMSLRVVDGHVLATVPLETRSIDGVVARDADGDEVARWVRPSLEGP